MIERAYEALNQFNWNETELIAYEQEIKRIWDNKAVEDFMIETAEARGEARGIAKGKAEGKAEGMFTAKIEIARNLLQAGVDIELVDRSTGLTIEEIELIVNKEK